MPANDDRQDRRGKNDGDAQSESPRTRPPTISGETRGNSNFGRDGDVLVQNDVVYGDVERATSDQKGPLPEPQNNRGWSNREESTLYDVEPSGEDEEESAAGGRQQDDVRQRQIDAAIEGLKAERHSK